MDICRSSVHICHQSAGCLPTGRLQGPLQVCCCCRCHTHYSQTLFVIVITKITQLLFCRVALVLLGLYKVSVSSRVADVEDFRTDMRNFVENISRHCTVEKLLEDAFMIPMATRRELNLLFSANKDSLTQKGISIHQKRWDYTKHVRETKICQGYCSQAC